MTVIPWATVNHAQESLRIRLNPMIEEEITRSFFDLYQKKNFSKQKITTENLHKITQNIMNFLFHPYDIIEQHNYYTH